MTTTAPSLDIFDLLGDYLPGPQWSDKVMHLVPPDDNGDREWTLVFEEVWRSPGFASLCEYMRDNGFPEPVKVGHGKVIDGTRMLVAAARVGCTDAVPVLYAD